MNQFNIEVKGKGKIMESFYIQAPGKQTQNWWLLKIENGPTSFILTVPCERSKKATMRRREEFCAGNVISFKATLDKERVMALSSYKIDSHLQGRLNI